MRGHRKKVVSVFFVSLSVCIEFEDKPAGILGVNKVVIRFPTRFDPTPDVWEEIVDFHHSVHFKKWMGKDGFR